MRVVVTGGRDYGRPATVRRVLREHFPITALAHGGARGVDSYAGSVARHYGIPVTVYLASWHADGRKAGPLRNRRMLDEFRPDVVLVFPGGRGTADCVRAARERGIRVVEVSP